MVDIHSLTTDQLEKHKGLVIAELKKRQAEPKKPIFVVEGSDSNNCYKSLDAAKADAIESIFFRIEKEEYAESYRCSVRYIPVSDYNKNPDAWLET